MEKELVAAAESLLKAARKRRIGLVTAESCTGGMVSAALTEVPGSSAAFSCGFATYSNRAKHRLLGVPKEILRAHGAVSGQTAEYMAKGALERAQGEAGLGIGITGIAGPGSAGDKPAGLVYIAVALADGFVAGEECHFSGSRHAVRLATALRAMAMAEEALARA